MGQGGFVMVSSVRVWWADRQTVHGERREDRNLGLERGSVKAEEVLKCWPPCFCVARGTG